MSTKLAASLSLPLICPVAPSTDWHLTPACILNWPCKRGLIVLHRWFPSGRIPLTLCTPVCPFHSACLCLPSITVRLAAPALVSLPSSLYQLYAIVLSITGAEGWRGGGGEEGEAKGNIWRRETKRVDGSWSWCHRRRHQPQRAACAEWPRRGRQRVWVRTPARSKC